MLLERESMNSPTNENQQNFSLTRDENKEEVSEEKVIPSKGLSTRLILFTLFLIILGIACFFYWYLYLRLYQSTGDAYASGNYVVVNSAIEGSVIAYFADDTDLVKEGQLLVLLDSTKLQIIYEKELATLASTVLQVRQLYDAVKINTAIEENRKALLERTRYDFQNRFNLIDSGAISDEDLVHAKNDLLVAEFNFKQAEYQLQSAQAAAGNTEIEKHPLIEQQKSNVRTAYYNLRHGSIYAPFTGYVAKRSVEVGQWISPRTALMAIIPTEYVWVDANFKETQLANMRIGQPASVWLDIYGSKVVYKGKVVGIASGTGSIFSLIPPQNATGNWIKIVQRLPVRISLDPKVVEKYPLRLGLSATVDVDITNQDLPLLANIPSEKAIAQTKVFDIQMEETNQLIAAIVQENLHKSQL